MAHSQRRTQRLTIVAKDPSVKTDEGRILTAQVEVPAEELAPGPRGYRVQVIDYDASSGLLYAPVEYRVLEDGQYNDPFAGEPDDTLLGDPGFHAQNVYAIVMRVLARFEFALGRRVRWSFGGHQLQVAPHAFADANAFYSKDDRALLFGYFPKTAGKTTSAQGEQSPPSDEEQSGAGEAPRKRGRYKDMVFTCLSHDVVAHETTHALLDGLRERYTDPSSPEQAGFHEGFADVVALLSIFSLPAVVEQIIDRARTGGPANPLRTRSGRIPAKSLSADRLKDSLIFSLGAEMGQEIIGRGSDLRRSINLDPQEVRAAKDGEDGKWREPHLRGEVLVAAMLNAFLAVWSKRIDTLGSEDRQEKQEMRDAKSGPAADPAGADVRDSGGFLDRGRVVEDGAAIADHLLTMAIRALDYCPPTDLEFCDFLSALLTADREMRPDDSRFNFRQTLRETFALYGMEPTSKGGAEPGIWEPPDCTLVYDRMHMASLLTDEDEVFRFLWENRAALGLDKDAYTRVLSVRPCMRINADDGFVLRETVAEYYQILNVVASELKHLGIKKPADLPGERHITLYGGGALIFDEFGHVKFHIRNRILNPGRQTRRLQYLWKYGHFSEPQILEKEAVPDHRFARMHQQRFGALPLRQGEAGHDDEYF